MHTLWPWRVWRIWTNQLPSLCWSIVATVRQTSQDLGCWVMPPTWRLRKKTMWISSSTTSLCWTRCAAKSKVCQTSKYLQVHLRRQVEVFWRWLTITKRETLLTKLATNTGKKYGSLAKSSKEAKRRWSQKTLLWLAFRTRSWSDANKSEWGQKWWVSAKILCTDSEFILGHRILLLRFLITAKI